MSDAVLYERRGRVGTITLNRPDNRNSMTPELLDAFASASAEAREDGEVRCVVVTGTGRCFSAGADFKSQVQRDAAGRQPHERSYAMYQPFLSVLDIEVPVIAALNGHAVGGGFGLALACDLRVGVRGAKYGANFTRLGLHPGMAISYLLPRLVGATRGAELLYTGRLIDGEEAERIGLFNEVLESAESVAAHAHQLAEAIAANAPIAVRMTKRTLQRTLDWDTRAAAFEEAYAQAVTLQTADFAEGVDALLAKRDPDFQGT